MVDAVGIEPNYFHPAQLDPSIILSVQRYTRMAESLFQVRPLKQWWTVWESNPPITACKAAKNPSSITAQ